MTRYNKILITGVTGFIGANLVYYFQKMGFDVYACKRKKSDVWRIENLFKNVRCCNCDLLNLKDTRKMVQKIKPDFIFHTACYGGFPFQKNEQKIFQVNLLGTVNLLNACAGIDFKLFVNTGSSSEYGLKTLSMKESELLEPITDYGVSKAAETLYVHSWAKKEKRPVVTLRLFSPFGYYEDSRRLIPSVILACLKGRPPKVSAPFYVRDFIFIEDVLSAYAKTLKNIKKISGEILNIGSGHQSTVGEVVEKILCLTGCKSRPLWGEISNPRCEPALWQADISKARLLLGWHPMFSLEEGLKKTIDWFKRSNYLYKSL